MPLKRKKFEVVPLDQIAHLIHPEQYPDRRQKKILSISYDSNLLMTREMILKSAGYRVRSVGRLQAALAECRLDDQDLVLIGHSIPLEHQERILKQVRQSSRAPVLALWRRGPEERLEGADYQLDALGGPMALLDMVRKILEPGGGLSPPTGD